MEKSKKNLNTLELSSPTIDLTNLEPIFQNMESKNPNESLLQPHKTGSFAVTIELIEQIIGALKKV